MSPCSSLPSIRILPKSVSIYLCFTSQFDQMVSWILSISCIKWCFIFVLLHCFFSNDAIQNHAAVLPLYSDPCIWTWHVLFPFIRLSIFSWFPIIQVDSHSGLNLITESDFLISYLSFVPIMMPQFFHLISEILKFLIFLASLIWTVPSQRHFFSWPEGSKPFVDAQMATLSSVRWFSVLRAPCQSAECCAATIT